MTIAHFPSPTVYLPSTKKIPHLPLGVLEDSLAYLRVLYNPPVRASRPTSRRKLFPTPQSRSIANSDHADSPLEHIQRDQFERSYSMRWLTSLISQIQLQKVDSWANEEESLVEDAASLLAICAGTASAGTFTRYFTFGRGMVNVRITDIPLENCDFSSVGAQTWGGSCVLAETIVNNPNEFGLTRVSSGPLRVLELGAGTGLVSVTLAQYLFKCDRSASIYPTDFNPTVLANLSRNIAANATSWSPQVTLTSAFLDWSRPEGGSNGLPDSFDLILGADITYELQHTLWIKGCLQQLLRKPEPSENHPPRFHLVIPLRPLFIQESGAIENAFPFAKASSSVDKTMELVIMSKDVIICNEDGDGKQTEVEYAYYVIGWQ
jgi:predicted nicotinamide N-methyase